MISGPSDVETVGRGAGGASLGGAGASLGAGASVGEGSTLVMAKEVLDEADLLGGSDEEETTWLGEAEAWALEVADGVDCEALDAVDDVTGMEGTVAEDSAACDEESGAEDATDVSAGADDGEGRTVVYCVTMTTGGTCSDVEGRSSTASDGVTVALIGEDTGMAGMAG